MQGAALKAKCASRFLLYATMRETAAAVERHHASFVVAVVHSLTLGAL
jgi:hypothetical protein